MIDLNLIRNETQRVHDALLKKGWDVDFAPVLAKMDRRLELIQKVEGGKAEANKLSKSVPQVKKEGGDVQAIFARVKEISKENADAEAE